MSIGLDISSVINYFFLLAGLYVAGSIILRFFRFPGKLIVNFICNGLVGLGLMLIMNNILPIEIAINPFNIAFVGVLGIPGVICLYVLVFIL